MMRWWLQAGSILLGPKDMNHGGLIISFVEGPGDKVTQGRVDFLSLGGPSSTNFRFG